MTAGGSYLARVGAHRADLEAVAATERGGFGHDGLKDRELLLTVEVEVRRVKPQVKRLPGLHRRLEPAARLRANGGRMCGAAEAVARHQQHRARQLDDVAVA